MTIDDIAVLVFGRVIHTHNPYSVKDRLFKTTLNSITGFNFHNLILVVVVVVEV